MSAFGEQPQRSSLVDLIGSGYVGPVWCDGHEVLRRIFVTVRDRSWNEIASTRWHTEIDTVAGSVKFNARHMSDEVDLEWQGVLTVSRDMRELRFTFEGKARRDMELCRVGLVLLHPVESMIESQLSMLSPHGEQRLTVPRLISPQPVVNGVPQAMAEPFSELVIERGDFGRLALEFTGDLFELEDQRNWGDASFKTYCTPLRLGFPRPIKAGATVAQSVGVRFAPVVVHKNSRAARDEKVTPATAFPTIGYECDPLDVVRRPGGSEILWHHVRFHLVGNEDVAAIQSALEAVPSIKVELQIELEPDQTYPAELTAFLSRFHDRILRLLVCGPGNSLPSSRAIDRLRRMAEESGALGLPLLASTRGYFVEFNRAVVFDAPVSGIAFPLIPTVHSDDVATITENAASIADIAETARQLTGLRQVVISPLALRYPRTGKRLSVSGALARSWLVATISHAALAGIESLTLGADLITALDLEGAETRRVISGLLDCAGLRVAPLGTPLPTNVHAIRFEEAGYAAARVLITNLNPQVARLSLAPDGSPIVRGADATTGAPVRFGERELEIPQFGTTWLDVEFAGHAKIASVGIGTH